MIASSSSDVLVAPRGSALRAGNDQVINNSRDPDAEMTCAIYFRSARDLHVNLLNRQRRQHVRGADRIRLHKCAASS